MDLGLSGASAVVSGGSTGMGLAAAESLAGEGARVALLARTQSVLDTAAVRLGALGAPDSIGIVTDLTVRASVDAAFATVESRWGGTQRVGQRRRTGGRRHWAIRGRRRRRMGCDL
jgi:3-oxoacyl-[acyl-carrier protein] reductase